MKEGKNDPVSRLQFFREAIESESILKSRRFDVLHRAMKIFIAFQPVFIKI